MLSAAGTRSVDSRRDSARALVLGAAVLLAALVFAPGSAHAAIAHKFLSHLEAPQPPGLTEPSAIAVNQKTGEVFVANEANGVGVEVFSASGAYETRLRTQAASGTGAATRVAVDEATGYVYAIAAGGGEGDELDVFKPTEGHEFQLVTQWSGAATSAGHFATLQGVAVDSSKGANAGDVFVIDEGTVEVFKPKPPGPEEAKEGELLSMSFAGLEEPTALAVNATEGNIYIADSGVGAIREYTPAGALVAKLKGKGSPTGGGLGPEAGSPETALTALAVNATGEVFVAAPEIGVVDQLDPAGNWIGWLTSAAGGVPFADPVGVALAPSGNIYVADFGTALVDIFGPGATGPLVRTKEPKTIERLGATLSGTITPEGKGATTYYFEYGEASAEGYSVKTPPVELVGEAKVAVNTAITGLTVGTGYKYRLVGETEGVAFYGQNLEFETLPAVEGVTTKPATSITATAATLNGALFAIDPNPESEGVHYYFQYGETNVYGKTSPVPPGTNIGTAGEEVAAATSITGLEPNTLYHYRLVGINSFGTTYGLDSFFVTHGPPRITVEPAVEITATGAVLKDRLNPDGNTTHYYFEYGETPPNGSSTRTPEKTIEPSAGVAKLAEPLTGLKVGVTYHYRLVASYEEEGKTLIVNGPDQTFRTALIESESATSVTSSGATLEAVIAPEGADVKYRFEYGTSAAYGTSTPVPDGDIAAGEPTKTVSQSIAGLTASTTYHYRVIAILGAETIAGADQTFTTAPAETAPPLPDARAYELVSPSNKHGALLDAVARTWGLTQASADGSAITYPSDGAITEVAEGNREPEPSQNLSVRGSEWSTQDLATPHERAVGLFQSFAEYRQFTPDLALSVVEPNPYGKTALAEPALTPPAQPGEVQEKTIYERADQPLAPAPAEQSIYNQALANGEQLSGERHETLPGYLALLTAANTKPGAKIGGILPPQSENEKPAFNQGHVFVTATPDLSHVVLRSRLEPFTTESTDPGLYEWSGGQLKLISVLPDGTPAPDAGLEAPGPRLGQGTEKLGENFRHALSEDGSRAVWSTPPEARETATELFLRDIGKGQTVRLDAVQGGPPLNKETRGEAQFQIANANDTRVFFTDPQRLTADSKALAGQPDLYVCEIIEVAGQLACNLTDLTVDHNAGESAGVRGEVLGASEDGSSVYFVAGGVLSSGANGRGETAVPLANNLYLLHNSAGTWSTTFIATLGTEDRNDFINRSANKPNAINELTSRVSPNGSYLAFMSARRLTGYDNTDALGGGADQEVFLYGAGSITCVSCNPSGARPRGVLDQAITSEGTGLLVDRAGAWVGQRLAGNIPTSNPDNEFVTQHQPRYLSDAGRLFFNSPSDLVPAAQNGKENVYEFERSGQGTCASTNGCIALISSGSSSHESAFLDASESGDSAFFLTAQPLSARDTDESFDIYAARVCTAGSPCLDQSVTPPPAPCEALETCRPVPPSAVTITAPATTSTGASGNLKPDTAVLPSKEVTKPKAKTPTRAQKLAKALKSCRKGPKHKRKKCEAQARKKYGKKTTTKGKH